MPLVFTDECWPVFLEGLKQLFVELDPVGCVRKLDYYLPCALDAAADVEVHVARLAHHSDDAALLSSDDLGDGVLGHGRVRGSVVIGNATGRAKLFDRVADCSSDALAQAGGREGTARVSCLCSKQVTPLF